MQTEFIYDCSLRFVHLHKFTGKERDTESGLDYFGARYYGSSMGRFMSPDWSAQADPVPYAKLDDPQSLNLYSYVLNNPLAMIDVDAFTVPESPVPCRPGAADGGGAAGRGWMGNTDVSTNTVTPTKDNPTGQQITVTFAASVVNSAQDGIDVGHEGSHVADGADYVKSGFDPQMNPTAPATSGRKGCPQQ